MSPLTTNILITMAGNGDRFRRAGFTLPKFKIEVCGRTLFHWALRSLNNFLQGAGEVVFAARPEHEPDRFIAEEAAALGIGRYRVLHFDRPTDGQATTALLAGAPLLDKSAPVLIYNIDTYVEPEFLRPADAHGNGWIPCFPGEGNGWSFARTKEGGVVEELAEKRRISPHATIGLYWFRSFDLYEACYREHFAHGGTAGGERYIAPMYNTLIKRGGGVRLSLIPKQAVHPLGTPEEVEAFQV
jgi:NDP-sugar pyrophosphorylase family protein